MRLLELGHVEVREIIEAENRSGEDSDGNPIYVMEIRGIQICAVVALDDGTTVITVYDQRA